ncbi:MAG TPA: hypothetical protein VFO39_02455 [Candidatus Sulfotelmatobacter sp.]|nr:hypothetical protein [Candidatus Sulfotelmatobacter sp.]
MPNLAQKLWRRARAWIPVEGFYFDRPLLLIQSDDWGRVGVRDREGLELFQAAGLSLGERPYDFYSLETAEDLSALRDVLKHRKDASGRSPCIGMNFVVHNLNFAPMEAEDFRQIHLLPLSDGLPREWSRPGLLESYREGMTEGLLCPALHGSTHFCRNAVESVMAGSNERADLLKTLWRCGTPYIHWRMPWIGYEYWNPNERGDQFLSSEKQRELIGTSVGAFAKMFSKLPRSACAPGYRANLNTHSVWAEYGIRVAQNGPGSSSPPHFDDNGLLHCYRNVEFEPAVDPEFSLETCAEQASVCFQAGIPAILSMHSINLHSSIKDFRSRTLQALGQLLDALVARHPDLLFISDEDLWELVQKGTYETASGKIPVNITKKKFSGWKARQH